MRTRISKNYVGRGTAGRKEVSLRINKSGLSADGKQRFVVAVRFTADAAKKASGSGYVAVEIDDETNRLYFVTASPSDGYKLIVSSKNGSAKSITFAVGCIDEWEALVGEYDLKKDVSDNSYYIDIAICPTV